MKLFANRSMYQEGIYRTRNENDGRTGKKNRAIVPKSKIDQDIEC